jgi:alpha-glucosidase (family GH31 glycosyl hydrolase)
MKRVAFLLLLTLGCQAPDAELPEPKRHTPRWAFEPWISKDISSTDDTYAFVDGFASRDIPVGAVVLDSPWETHYNTFIPNPVRYHHFEKLVSDLHARGIRLVLWVTQMVNSTGYDFEPGGDTYAGPSPNHQEALERGFLVNDGDDYIWWKGNGGGLDFFNPQARSWWHAQQDALMALGLDGWKLDFGEMYVLGETFTTFAGPMSRKAYQEAYYRDYLAYGVQQRGPEFVTMVRGWDESYFFPGQFFARPEHAPVVWAGDNRRDWVGLVDALDHVFRSARAGYVVVGSDVGGYLDIDDKTHDPVPASQTTFVRWTAVAALTPFMQLHGRANLAPWTVAERPDETVEIYRYWSKLHHDLVPFFYSLAERAYAGGPPLLDPVGPESAWPGDYRFTVGDAFLMAPILDDTGKRDVVLPAGVRWYDWWQPSADARDGGQTLAAYDATDRHVVPLFVRQGAIVPMVSALRVWPAATATSFTIYEDDGGTRTVSAQDTGAAYTLSLSQVRTAEPVVVRTDRTVTSATLDGQPLTFTTDAAARTVSFAVAPGTDRKVSLNAP